MVLTWGLSSAAERATFVLIKNKTTEWAARWGWEAEAKICGILPFCLLILDQDPSGLGRSLATGGAEPWSGGGAKRGTGDLSGCSCPPQARTCFAQLGQA